MIAVGVKRENVEEETCTPVKRQKMEDVVTQTALKNGNNMDKTPKGQNDVEVDEKWFRRLALRIGADWEVLGSSLGYNLSQLGHLELVYPSQPCYMIQTMFRKWWKTAHDVLKWDDVSLKQIFAECFEDARMEDLAKEIHLHHEGCSIPYELHEAIKEVSFDIGDVPDSVPPDSPIGDKYEVSTSTSSELFDNTRETVTVKIIRKSKDYNTYKNPATEATLTYFNIIGADEKHCYTIRSYLGNYNRIREGITYRFENLVRRGDELWLVKGSILAITKKIQKVPADSNRKLLPEEEPPEGATRLLHDALKSMQLSTVVGRIIKISPFKTKGALTIRSVVLLDSHGTAKVCLFQEDAKMDFRDNDVIEVKMVYCKNFAGKAQLTATRKKTVTKLPNRPDLEKLKLPEIDIYQCDPDFQSENHRNTFELDAIYWVKVSEKNESFTCKTNKSRRTSEMPEREVWVEASVQVINKYDNTKSKVILYRPAIQELFKLKDFTSVMDTERLENHMIQQWPGEFQANFSNKQLSKICFVEKQPGNC